MALADKVNEKATSYWNATNEESIEAMPVTIVDFVIEYMTSSCHFPKHFTADVIESTLERYVSTLAMACVEVYAKAGAEGEKVHRESDMSLTYSTAWISDTLVARLPNYVSVIS